MKSILLKGGTVVSDGQSAVQDVRLKDGLIEQLGRDLSFGDATVVDCTGKYVLPGCIDDQVHFREPGLTHKAELFTESRAAVAGGITSFMEMPNTVPNTLTQQLLADKYELAAQKSVANYSFFMGASNDNLEEVLKTDPKKVCGVKVFMGSSTGNMLVDNEQTLRNIFGKVEMLIAVHCEDEATIRANTIKAKEKFGEDVPFHWHPVIRDTEACYKSSSFAVQLAKEYMSRLHILHISTAKELDLFRNDLPLNQKRITAEACIHHLWFSDEDYAEKGPWIKWNPAVKSASDREAIWKAVLDNRIDVIATDHAPHTIDEKSGKYFQAPSGGPLVQHALIAMLDKSKAGLISLERVVEKMCHAPAELFRIENRGYIREGFCADIVVVDPHSNTPVTKQSILSKCGWSPFEDHIFSHRIHQTYVNGELVYANGKIVSDAPGKRLTFASF